MTHPAIQRTQMRWLWVWIVAIVLASSAFGGVTGRVSSIGFQSFIRPEDWVPIVVQITSDEPAAHTYDLQIVQNDLDGDESVYTRSLTVNPGTQTFRTYFRPETLNHGLPASGSDTPEDLAKRLRVFLFDPATSKRAVRIAVSGATPQALEASGSVGQKLILIVGRSPNVSEFVPTREKIIGLAEQCYFVQVDPKRLPDSALALCAVDAIVWTDADTSPRGLDGTQLQAIRNYVRSGGTLVVIANADANRTAAFDDMLPVKVNGSVEWNTAEPLKSILQPPGQPLPRSQMGRRLDPWQFAKPPYRMADATPADNTTIIDTWTAWPDGHRSPLIARRLFGLGCVAWIAEDISEPSLATVDFGWPRLWERLMDWRDTDLTLTAAETPPNLEQAKGRYATDTSRDLGAAFKGGMNPGNVTTVKITIAVVFFIVYWVLAGPVSYFVLAAKKKTTLSWFIFGLAAAGATALTVGISALVLRGSAQVQHLSLVRLRANEPARVQSHVGVYLPKDTRATPVALPISADNPPTSLTPFGTDPRYSPDDVTLRPYSSYPVAVGQNAEATEAQLDVPFRSTLKKLQADWSGPLPAGPVTGGITGQVRLVDDAIPLDGQLSNDTGLDLYDVILVFRSAIPDAEADRPIDRGDLVIALPLWKKGQTFDLRSLWKGADPKPVTLPNGRLGVQLAGTSNAVRGRWADALSWLYSDLRTGKVVGVGMNSNEYDDHDSHFPRSFPLVSLFSRCAPMMNYPGDASRADVTRHGVRSWDVSPAVAGGAMVVLAKSDDGSPLPLPLTVEGDPPASRGQTLFQLLVPIDRSAFHSPVPTTQSAGDTQAAGDAQTNK